MQESKPVRPADTAHNVNWVMWVGGDESTGALVVEPEDGCRVRWETVTRSTFDNIDLDQFNASLRTVYGTEVDREDYEGDTEPDIIAPPMHTFEKHTLYLPEQTKERLLSFYESWGEDIDRYYQHEASLQVALEHVDEIGDNAVSCEAENEERYAVRVEEGTWDDLQTSFLRTELEHPSLDTAPRRHQYHGLVETILTHKTEIKKLANALACAE